MHARSALFDLYGDHLRERDGVAPIAALVRLLAPLGIAAPAVRTAVSRMVRQGWLEPVRMPRGPAYALTEKAVHRLDDAARRVYRDYGPWDGHWELIVIDRVRDRARRERLAAGLAYLGFGRLGESTWIGPRASAEVDPLLRSEGARAERFRSVHQGDARELLARVWDLSQLGQAYDRWLTEARILTGGGEGPNGSPYGTLDGTLGATLDRTPDLGSDRRPEPGPNDHGGRADPDEQAFAVRSRLVHEWRKFLFHDPWLPEELLPADWPGTAAARFFDAESARLLPRASRFIDRCLREPANHRS